MNDSRYVSRAYMAGIGLFLILLIGCSSCGQKNEEPRSPNTRPVILIPKSGSSLLSDGSLEVSMARAEARFRQFTENVVKRAPQHRCAQDRHPEINCHTACAYVDTPHDCFIQRMEDRNPFGPGDPILGKNGAYYYSPYPAFFPFNSYGRDMSLNDMRAASENIASIKIRGPLLSDLRRLPSAQFKLYEGNRNAAVTSALLEKYDEQASEVVVCGGAGFILVPAKEVEASAKVITEWKRLEGVRVPGNQRATVIRVEPEENRTSISALAYCRGAGPDSMLRDCRIVYAKANGREWLLAAVSPHNGTGCGAGETDLSCDFPKGASSVKNADAIATALRASPLLLDAHESDEDYDTWKRRFKPSSVFPGFFEHTIVAVRGSEKKGYRLATTILVSKQKVSAVDGMRGLVEAEQTRYNEALQRNLEQVGMKCRKPSK